MRRVAINETRTLAAKLTRAQHEAAGITRYRWVNVPRPTARLEHAVISGNIYTYKDGHPTEGHPGDQINCLCQAEPLVDQ